MGVLITDQVPASGDNSDGGVAGITTGTLLTFAADDTVTHVQFRATATVVSGETYTAELWHVTGDDSAGGSAGTRLVSAAVAGSSITPSALNEIAITPTDVTAGQVYKATLNSSGGRYVLTGHFFDTDPLTNDGITAPASPLNPGFGNCFNGTFTADSGPNHYPTDSFNNSFYFVGVRTASGAVADLVGDAAPAVTAVGDLIEVRQLAGDAPAGMASAGTLAEVVQLAGDVGVSSAVAGLLQHVRELAGVVVAALTVRGDVRREAVRTGGLTSRGAGAGLVARRHLSGLTARLER